MNTMSLDGDLDFLKYLDFDNKQVVEPDDECSYYSTSSAGTTSSTFASPQERAFSDCTSSNGQANSPSPPPPMSLFPQYSAYSVDTTFNPPPTIKVNDHQQPFAWDFGNNNSSSTMGTLNTSVPATSTTTAPQSYPGSPPFDVNLFSPKLSSGATVQNQATVPDHPSLESLGFSDPHAGFTSQASLAQQYQQLLVQQAQMQLQMQMQQQQLQQQIFQQRLSSSSASNMSTASSSPPLTTNTSNPPSNGNATTRSSSANSQPQLDSNQILKQLLESQKATSMPDPYKQSSNVGQQVDTSKKPSQDPSSLTLLHGGPATAIGGISSAPSLSIQPLASLSKKATLKRSYQPVKAEHSPHFPQVKMEETDISGPSSSMSRMSSQDSTKDDENQTHSNASAKGGHNAVEQKYRRGINDSLIMLREIVPALQHLRAAPGTAPTKRKISQFSLAASATPSAPSGFVDGVLAPKKLSKQLILLTATDYIRFLISRREELEGELSALKNTIEDCVEDSQVVMDVFESRWAPHRARILEERTRMAMERHVAKEKNKKRKTESGGSARAAAGSKRARKSTDSDDSEEDEDDSEEEEEEVDQNVMGASSAIEGRGQARARKQPRKATKPAASLAPAAAQAPRGPPKSLMSVFAGVSFAGGAAYDLIYGASGASQQATTPEARVWTHGLVKRASVQSATNAAQTNLSLHPLQSFFLDRPALLSGFVMLSMSIIASYLFLYLLPAVYDRFTASSKSTTKAKARRVLLEAAKLPSSYSARAERKALAALADAPSSPISELLRLPFSSTLFLCNVALRRHASKHLFAEDVVPADLERAASALRLLEVDFKDGEPFSPALLSSFFHLFNLTRSSQWPATRQTASITAKAEAVLALVYERIFGSRMSFISQALWTSAQSILKKEDGSDEKAYVRLSAALSQTFSEAVEKLSMSSASSSPLLSLTEARYQDQLFASWKNMFAYVVHTTSVAKSHIDGTSTPTKTTPETLLQQISQDTGIIEEILTVMPVGCDVSALALLYKGIDAIGKNDKAQALQIAQQLVAADTGVASVQAFISLVSDGALGEIPTKLEQDVDIVAYVTIAWLFIRSSHVASAKEDADVASQKASKDDTVQLSAVHLRRLLAANVFNSCSTEDDVFAEAQERCIEGLVSVGRKAAGLDSLSDSGCEM